MVPLLVASAAQAQVPPLPTDNAGAQASPPPNNAPSTGTSWTSAPATSAPGTEPQPAAPNSAPVAAAPPPVQYVAVPIEMAPGFGAEEPPPPPERKVDPATIHRHDGFFLRMGIGAGYLWNTMKEPNFEYKVRGTVVPLEILIGGSLIPGLVAGGGLWIAPGAQLRTEGSGADTTAASDLQMTFYQLGPFVDYYIDPTQGFHVLLAATLAGFQMSLKDSVNTTLSPSRNFNPIRADGFAVTGGVGQEFWIGNQWSVGGMLRLTYATLEDTNAVGVVSHQVWNPALVATFTYH